MGKRLRNVAFVDIFADEKTAGIRAKVGGHGSLPQEQRLLGDQLFIVPELDRIQTSFLEQAISDTEGHADDFKGIRDERDRPRSRAKNDLPRVDMLDFDAPVRRTTTS